MAYEAGTAWLQVVPSFLGIEPALKAAAAQIGRTIEESLATAIPRGIAKGAAAGQVEAARAGAGAGSAYAEEMRRRLEAGFKALPKPNIEGDFREFNVELAEVRAELEQLHGQRIGIDIDEATFLAEVEILRQRLRELRGESVTIQAYVDAKTAEAQLDEILRVANTRQADLAAAGDAAGRAYGGRFGEQVRARVEAALKALPAAKLRADATAADREIDAVRGRLAELSGKTIGVDINEAGFFGQIAILEARLRTLAEKNVTLRVRTNATEAAAELEALVQLTKLRQAQLDAAAEQAGREYGGHFGEQVRSRVAAALEALPKAKITADSTEADVKLAGIRNYIDELSRKRVGIDIDETSALAQLAYLRSQLDEIARSDPSVRVRANAGEAAAQLAAILELEHRVNDADPTVEVRGNGVKDTATGLDQIAIAAESGFGRLGALIALGASLGTALVPAAAAASAAVGAIGTAALGAGSGIGVLVLGLSGIGGAVQALDQYQNTATRSATSLGQAENRVASAHDAVASALDQVTSSQASAANAQRQLVRAEADEKSALQDLTRAREDARRAQQDAIFTLKDNALAERQAVLDVKAAKADLDRLLANPRATADQLEQARITFESKSNQLDELKVKQQRLETDQKAANKAGIDGSQQVVAAQKRVASAVDQVASAQGQVAAAHRQLLSSQRAVAAANRQVAQSFLASDSAGGQALNTLRNQFALLSPQGRQFATFLYGAKLRLIDLRNAVQAPLLPRLQEALGYALPALPQLEMFLGRVATAVGDLAVQAVHGFGDPVWQRFFGFAQQEAIPALKGLFSFGQNVTKGLASLYLAFTPFNHDVGTGLISFSQRFAVWAQTLGRTQGFQHFLEYVRTAGPEVVSLLGHLATTVEHIVEGAAPVGLVVVKAITDLSAAINAIPLPVLKLLVGIIAGVSAGLLILVARQKLWALSNLIATTGVTKLKDALNATAGVVAQYAATSTTGYSAVARSTDEMYASMVRYGPAATTAATKTGLLGRALTGARVTGGLAKAGLSGLVSFFGGPWGIALTAATIGIGYFTSNLANTHAQLDAMQTAMASFGDALKDGITPAALQSADAILKENEGLRGLVDEARAAGISQQELVAGLNGDEAARTRVIDAIQRHIAALDAQSAQDPFLKRTNDAQVYALTKLQVAFAKTNTAAAEAAKLQQQFLLAAFGATGGMVQQAHAIDLANSQTQKYLADLQLMGDHTANLTDRVAALRDVLEQVTKAKQDQIDQSLDYRQAQVTSQQAIQNLKTNTEGLSGAELKHAKALDGTTQASIDQERALIARAKAIRDGYLADLEAGTPETQAYKRLTDRTKALEDEYKQAGFNVDRVRDLANAETSVPGDVRTSFSQENFPTTLAGLTALIGQIAYAQYVADQITFQQYQTKVKAAKDEAQADLDLAAGRSDQRHGHATGGLIRGPGTSTSDSIPAWLSDYEFVHQAAAVRYYGSDWMDAVNQMSIPRQTARGMLTPPSGDPQFAQGGLVRLPVVVDAAKLYTPGSITNAAGGLGAQQGQQGWQWQINVLRAAFPGLALLSGFRPGAHTVTGNLSYHALGRAVDVPPRPDVFDWIRSHYGATTKELIFTPEGARQIWNGKPHIFSGPVAAEHWSHVHWAYDQGGYLPPGLSTVYNGTGKPEPVLTTQQLANVQQVAEFAATKPGIVNQNTFNFRDTTLTAQKLQTIQDRQAIMSRLGRAR